MSIFVLSSKRSESKTMSDQAIPGESPIGEHRSDEDLMLGFSTGNTEDFDELFRRYKQPLFGFFRRRLTDPTQAEELTQDTFIAVLRAASRYQPSALFRTYLYAIGLRILNAYKRRTAFRSVFFGAFEVEKEPSAQKSANSIDAEIQLRQALRKLDSTDREILLLREFEELSYAEIAGLLHLPINTVRSRLFRARIALRNLLTAPALNPQSTNPAAASKGIEARS